MDSLIVPSSIQRIRAFLVEMCGMKVKPWASAEETLAALHDTLVAKQGCDIFWTSLRVLLEALARDLKARQAAAPGTLLDNEILSAERYASLLDEIRACLAKQENQQLSSFGRLARGLSTPALALLLLLGGVAAVGCDHAALPGKTADAAVADVPPHQPDSALAPPEVNRDSAPDSIYIVLPDVAAPKNDVREAASTGSDGASVTIEDIMDSCAVSSATQAQILACLASLRQSWTTGISETLAGADCHFVLSQLQCFTSSRACLVGSTRDFDPKATPICDPILIYVGVRFV